MGCCNFLKILLDRSQSLCSSMGVSEAKQQPHYVYPVKVVEARACGNYTLRADLKLSLAGMGQHWTSASSAASSSPTSAPPSWTKSMSAPQGRAQPPGRSSPVAWRLEAMRETPVPVHPLWFQFSSQLPIYPRFPSQLSI